MEEFTFTYNASKHSYIYHDRGLSFQDANKHCKTMHHGKLTIPDNNQTLNDLFDGYRKLNLTFDYYRIGLKQQNNLMEWIDESRLLDNSRVKIPDQSFEPCKGFAVLFKKKQSPSQLQFYAANCSYRMAYICEKSMNIDSTSTTFSNIAFPQVEIINAAFTSTTTTTKTFVTDTLPWIVEKDQVEKTDITTKAATTNDNSALLAGCIIAACIIFVAFVLFIASKLSRRQDANKRDDSDTYYSTVQLNDKSVKAAHVSVRPTCAPPSEYASIQVIDGQSAADSKCSDSVSPVTSLQMTYAMIDKNKLIHENDARKKHSVSVSSPNKVNSLDQPDLHTSEYSSTNGFSASEYDCLVFNPPTARPEVTYVAVDRRKNSSNSNIKREISESTGKL